jgi:Coenzyme PQQ synthesis protein D (PqqD)
MRRQGVRPWGQAVRAEWPEGASRPSRRHGASGVPLDDNLAIYDEVGQLLILLNVGAASVWERCDGTATFGDITADLARAHSGDAAAIAKDAWLTVRKLAELGLVTDAAEVEGVEGGVG